METTVILIERHLDGEEADAGEIIQQAVSAWLTFSSAFVAQKFAGVWLKNSLTFTDNPTSNKHTMGGAYCSSHCVRALPVPQGFHTPRNPATIVGEKLPAHGEKAAAPFLTSKKGWLLPLACKVFLQFGALSVK